MSISQSVPKSMVLLFIFRYSLQLLGFFFDNLVRSLPDGTDFLHIRSEKETEGRKYAPRLTLGGLRYSI